MIGIPSIVPWAFVFTNIDAVPRHPAPLCAAIYCGFLFVLAFYLWRRKLNEWKNGMLSAGMVPVLSS